MEEKSITQWLEDEMPSYFSRFKEYIKDEPLFDKNKSIHKQDYTMLVGIFKGFFNKTPYKIDCGLSDDEIKKAFLLLQDKENPHFIKA